MLTKNTRAVLNGVDITEHIEGPVSVTISPNSPEKDRALFYLDRRLKALEEQTAQHESLAKSGVSYAERIRVEEQLDKKNEDNQHERAALQWLRDQAVEKL